MAVCLSRLEPGVPIQPISPDPPGRRYKKKTRTRTIFQPLDFNNVRAIKQESNDGPFNRAREAFLAPAAVIFIEMVNNDLVVGPEGGLSKR